MSGGWRALFAAWVAGGVLVAAAGLVLTAAALAALQVASELEEGCVVTVFPDAGYKYLSDKALWGVDS